MDKSQGLGWNRILGSDVALGRIRKGTDKLK